jgi:hypothetical protein
MAKTLKQFDAEFSKLIASSEYSDEDVFNLGLKIGKMMQVTGTTEFRPSIFIEMEKKEIAYNNEKARKVPYSVIASKINDFVYELMRNAIKEQLIKHRYWTTNKRDYRYKDGKLDEEISSKYCIQFLSCTYKRLEEVYIFKFEFVGKLRDIILANTEETTFDVHYSNYGSDRKDETIDSNDAINDMSIDRINFISDLYDLELSVVEKFWIDLHKPFLFMMMKNS